LTVRIIASINSAKVLQIFDFFQFFPKKTATFAATSPAHNLNKVPNLVKVRLPRAAVIARNEAISVVVQIFMQDFALLG